MNIFCIIPARGGSKGVPQKNIKPFLGEPLITHSIQYARASSLVTDVFVSTDDAQITAISERAGAKVIQRPPELSGDTASTESAITHALSWWKHEGNIPDVIILLQATSPLRPEGSLNLALKHFADHGFDSLLSISPTHRFFWKIKGDQTEAEYDFQNRPRRQDMTESDIRHVENGSLYIFTRELFEAEANRLGGKIGYFIFPEDFSFEIDTENDFLLLTNIASKIKGLAQG